LQNERETMQKGINQTVGGERLGYEVER